MIKLKVKSYKEVSDFIRDENFDEIFTELKNL
jgi:hypothetical protein